MQCKCGGMTIDQTHIVTTKEKASEWAKKEVEPPVKIHQYKCPCGYTFARIFKDNELIAQIG